MAVSKLTAVLGTCRRKGRWEVSKNTSALVVFGRCHVDYRDANADPELERITIKVFCLFGAVTMIMRAGTDVRPSVVSLLASSRCDVESGEDEDGTGFPPVVLEVTTLFGRCRVLSSPEDVDEAEEEEMEIEHRRAGDISESSPSADGVGATPALVAPTVEAPVAPRSPVSLLGATVASLSTTSEALPEDSAQTSFHDPTLPMRHATPTTPTSPAPPAAPPPAPAASFDDQARSAVAAESDEASVADLAFVDQLDASASAPVDVGEGTEPSVETASSEVDRRLSDLDPAKAVDLAAGPTVRVSAS